MLTLSSFATAFFAILVAFGGPVWRRL